MNISETTKNFNAVVKRAITGGAAKPLATEMRRIGWNHSSKWIYGQGEIDFDRESIIERFLKFMVCIRRADFAAYEYLKLEIDLFLDSPEIVGVPQTENPVEMLCGQIIANVERIKRAILPTKEKPNV